MTMEVGSPEWRSDQAARQEKLNRCLRELCEVDEQPPESLSHVAYELLEVYKDQGFRHRYADIFEVVHDPEETEDYEPADRAQYFENRGLCLASNLRSLYTHECIDSCEDPCPIRELQKDPRLGKLYDHANLESRRAGYESATAEETLASITEAIEALSKAIDVTSEAEEQAELAAKAASDATIAANKASKKAKRLQTEMVSVLGVFSAIILAFNASVTFTTSAISAVDKEPPFSVAFVVSVVGLVLFNCLYAAFAFVYRIIRPENSPVALLNVKRIVGIELVGIALTVLFGTLAYWNGGAFTLFHALGFGAFAIALIFSLVCLKRS